MAAFVELVGMDEFGIGPLDPTARSCIDLFRKDAHGYRDGDVFSLLVVFHYLGRPHMRLIWITSAVPQSLTLPQQIPALI
jgi:hypothetical protein